MIQRRLVLGFVFLWFFIGGVAHLCLSGLFTAVIPPVFPDHLLLVLVSGVFELLGAVGILLAPTRAAAGWGLVLLTIAVTPANVFMWQHAADFPLIPAWALAVRLPLQLVLLLGIWWSTRPRAG